jgi:hypothetical protein
MQFEKLDDTNFLLYAGKNYDNPLCFGTLEFYEDLNRFKYLKRLFSRYEETGELKERLILNHIIVLYNLFGVDAATKMLFFKIEKKFWSQLKTFLVFLNFMPIKIIVSKNIEIIESDIPLDNTIVNTLRKL